MSTGGEDFTPPDGFGSDEENEFFSTSFFDLWLFLKDRAPTPTESKK